MSIQSNASLAMATLTKQRLNQAVPSAKLLQQDVEKMIYATPTSEKRNRLTEANIHLMLAVNALMAAQAI